MSRRTNKRARKLASDPDAIASFDLTAAEVQGIAAPSSFSVDSVSGDRRRIVRESIVLPSTVSSPRASVAPTTNPSPSSSAQEDWADSFLLPTEDAEGSDGDPVAEKAKRYETTDIPMKSFIPQRQLYLDELLRRDGRGHATHDICKSCPDQKNAKKAVIRCSTCAPGPLSCEDCAVRKHLDIPYHCIKRWSGTAFEDTTLKDIGLTLQLGHHHDRTACSNPIPCRADFSVIHINGRHLVSVNFCGCDNAARTGNIVQQLLRYDLWPATDCEPNTTFTFELLEHYHVQSLQGKISMYDYYEALERMTDNTGTARVQDRYKAFMRVIVQWRHLKLLKRAGRGHDPTGVNGMQQGELAMRCPACPHPGINLPDNWESISDDLKYLYMMTVAIDACFRLKRRAVSDEHKDPILGSGWGYWVKDTGYKELLAEYGDQSEMSTCTGLSAVDHANTKFSRGYAATGIGAVVCARHEFWLAHGLGDIQKGEKYVNMDYIFVSAMCDYLVLKKIVSYDIACQWSTGLLERIAKFPRHLQIELPEGSVTYVIPKLHFGAHKQEGHSPYSLNYRVGVGRTDGEGVERNWWEFNASAASTKQMGPGQRQGYFEDHCSHSNWRKTVKMPWTLRKRLREAREQCTEQSATFDDLSRALKDYNTAVWEAAVVAWEANPFKCDDPYVVASQGPTEAETLRELVEEEQRASAVPGFIALHDVSVVGFVTMGLELEEAKLRITEDAKNATASRVATLFERRTALRRKLQKFRELQGIYMPRAVALLSQDPACRLDVELVEEVRLGLPSEIAPSRRDAVCSSRLQEVEARLRESQCRDALQNIRNQLHTLDHLFRYKKTHVRHQGANTRTRGEISTQDVRKARATAKESGPGSWERELRVLEDNDIRGISDDDPSNEKKRKRMPGDRLAPAEGRRQISWIWRTSDMSSSEEMTDSLRVEWLKARARTMRWREEIKLLLEEMRRVLATHSFMESKWIARARTRQTGDSALQEGLVSYAQKQANIRRRMRAVFRAVCIDEARKVKGATWVEEEEWKEVTGLVALSLEEPSDENDMYEMYEPNGDEI
ncbi:hypothetical protein K466DRAFT_606615 [Polyporus arcularius HHB13444]|uniref:CxC2-like cysteine cluster KDZ transposase-associated domain-containing protein n=1 Tax=Polyporus arcularius HHB13444 TaxID=1314778 RepID=A0A5C3NMW8_9APHY|nr:hypothetical protein K466DRAFT_606615 [Polyporus arcularius HHB13444]